MKRHIAGLFLASLLVAAQAGAAPLFHVVTNDEEKPEATPASNNYIVGLQGWDHAALYFDGDAGVQYLVTFSLVFAESGYENTLNTPGGKLTEKGPGGTGAAQSGSVSFLVWGGGPTLLDFWFSTPNQINIVNDANVADGSNTNPLRSFFVSFCEGGSPVPDCSNPKSGDRGFLLFDDSGAGPDDNHDDWVGTFRATAVPDGGMTIALLGLGLAGIEVIRRRARR